MADTETTTIEKLLGNMGGGGDFSSKLLAEPRNLKVVVEGVGQLKFPLTKAQAKALIQKASHAPFGHRERTLTDLSVRNVWEIKKNNIKIDNVSWNKTLRPILRKLQDHLGFPPGKVKATLDKLLIYEKGQFFAPHQDSEKANGMLGSLIVVLSSPHKGGTLVVSHHGESRKYMTLHQESRQLKFFGLYADCLHEIKKVTEGYRIALTYHLNVVPAKTAPSQRHLDVDGVPALKSAVQSYFACPPEETEKGKGKNKKFVYLLDHQYTPKGLCREGLKNGDYIRFGVLQKIARELDYRIFLALADVYECWSCEPGYSRWPDSWYGRDDDDVEYERQELVDGHTELRYWKSPEGESLDYGEMGAGDDEIFLTKATDKFYPFNSEHEGWMGNYGNTEDRWYHRAAVVLWPQRHHFDGIAGAGAAHAISIIEEAIAAEGPGLLRRAFDTWSGLAGRSSGEGEKALLKRALKIVERLNDSSLATQMLRRFDICSLHGDLVEDFLQLSRLYGAGWCSEVLALWLHGLDSEALLSSARHLPALVTGARAEGASEEERAVWDNILQQIAQKNVAAFIEHYGDEENRGSRVALRAGATVRAEKALQLSTICRDVGDGRGHAALIAFLCSDRDLFPPESLNEILQHLRAGEGGRLSPEERGVEAISRRLLELLRTFLYTGRRSKDDWSIRVKMPCSCGDCRKVKSFLASRDENTVRLPLAKERRQHLHQEIDGLGVDVSHETLRWGRPYKLVLKKLSRLFYNEEKIFRQRQKIWHDLQQSLTTIQ